MNHDLLLIFLEVEWVARMAGFEQRSARTAPIKEVSCVAIFEFGSDSRLRQGLGRTLADKLSAQFSKPSKAESGEERDSTREARAAPGPKCSGLR